MKHEKEKSIIKNYIESYNKFDIKGMIRDVDEDVVFENIINDKVDLELKGKENFEQQAEASKQYFRTRNQQIESWSFDEFSITVNIHYSAVIAIDLSNGLKSGDSLELRGRSEFIIKEGKIKMIRDYDGR